MLFDSGVPSLVSWTRALIGDPASAASPQWDDTTEVEIAINRQYLMLREIGRGFGGGTTTKRALDDAVAGQIEYDKPDDLVKLEAVELSGNGANLSTASPSTEIIYCRPWPAEKAYEAYNTEVLTEAGTRCFLQDSKIGIVAPPTAAMVGTNTIRFLYEASTAELTTNDEPELPRPHHDLICMLAAIELKDMRDMDFSSLWVRVYGQHPFDPASRMFQFKSAMQDALAMHEDTIAAQGLISQRGSIDIVSGTARRRRSGSWARDRY